MAKKAKKTVRKAAKAKKAVVRKQAVTKGRAK